MYVLIVIFSLKQYLVYLFSCCSGCISSWIVSNCCLEMWLSVFVWWLKMENVCLKLKNF